MISDPWYLRDVDRRMAPQVSSPSSLRRRRLMRALAPAPCQDRRAGREIEPQGNGGAPRIAVRGPLTRAKKTGGLSAPPPSTDLLYQVSMIMTHRDRGGGPSGRRGAAGDAAHRQSFPTPSHGPPPRPERRLPKAFGRRRARFEMPGIATAHAPSRKPW